MSDASPTSTLLAPDSARRVTFWGLVVPFVVLTFLIKFWYLHQANVIALGWLAFAESMRKSVMILFATAAIAMLAAQFVRRRWQFAVVLAAAQGLAMSVALFEGSGALFAVETGSTLDLYVLQAGMATDLVGILDVSVPSQFQLLILADLFVCLTLPWYFVWRGAPQRWPRFGRRGWALTFVTAVVIALVPTNLRGADARVAIAQSPVMHIVEQLPLWTWEQLRDEPHRHREGLATIERRRDATPRNVVFVVLESMRRDALTVYEPDLETSPTMAEIAKESLVFDRAYAPMPVTSKALVAMLCGVYPDPTVQLTEAVVGRIPQACLPELLGSAGYASLFLHPARASDQLFRPTVVNLGFDDSLHLEDLDVRSFRRVNYVGYEEATMLEPSREWLARQVADGRPFLLTYLTTSTHHDYAVPADEVGSFDDDDEKNRYLSGVRMTDDFVAEVVAMLEELGVWENTILVLVGDHGEAFGEHHVTQHNGVLYEEVLRVPMVIRAPEIAPRTIDAITSQVDLLPTLVTLSGHRLVGGDYAGHDVTEPVPARPLYASCFYDRHCTGLLRWPTKFVHNHGRRPDELYDLAVDPGETTNLVDERPEVVRSELEALKRWYDATRAAHGSPR